MKIILVTEGGESYGFGHLTRCISLYQEFEKNGFSPLVLLNGDKNAVGLFRNIHCKTFNWIKEYSVLEEIITKADIVVIDSYSAGPDIYRMISRLARVPVYIDDNKRLDYPRGIVINGNIYATSIIYPQAKNTFYLLGTRYTPLRQDFIGIKGKHIKKDICKILITLGGSDVRKITAPVVDFILTNFLKVKLKIISGAKNDFLNDNQKRAQYYYRSNSTMIKKLMLDVDIAVSAGGQTIYELARTGTPTIGICVAGNQINNLKGCEKAGFLINCGWYNSPQFFKRLKSALTLIQCQKQRLKMRSAGRSHVDARGAQRVVEKILSFRKDGNGNTA